MAEAHSERDTALVERERAVAERDAASAERDGVIAERDAIVNSIVWRFFKPYRAFLKFVKRS